jgi:hypothetical protein
MRPQDQHIWGSGKGDDSDPAGLGGLGQTLRWYVAGAVAHHVPRSITSATFVACDYWFLLTASDSLSAREKSLELAARAAGSSTSGGDGEWRLDGLTELLLVAEPPSNGSELMWASQEVPSEEVSALVRPNHELPAFLNPSEAVGKADWYVCTVVLVEIHETGTHGHSSLVWMNSYLLQSPCAESAFRQAVALGSADADESLTHRCNGDVARWEFKGLRDLRRTLETPADGALLWTETCELTADELARRIPAPEDLSVFEWERRSSSSD